MRAVERQEIKNRFSSCQLRALIAAASSEENLREHHPEGAEAMTGLAMSPALPPRGASVNVWKLDAPRSECLSQRLSARGRLRQMPDRQIRIAIPQWSNPGFFLPALAWRRVDSAPPPHIEAVSPVEMP